MTTWIDFKELRSRVSIEDVLLRYYDLKTLQRDGKSLVGPCPVHRGDSPRAFHADLERNLWHCFSVCKTGGNQLDLVAKCDGISLREAALRLDQHFPRTTPTADTPPKAPTRPAAPAARAAPPPENLPVVPVHNPPLSLRLHLLPDHPHLIVERKLPPETIAHFGVGYCPRGILAGMIAIPIHDATGELVAYAGRRLKPTDIREHGKYKLPKGFHRDLILYNLHRVSTRERVHVVEGAFSVMALHALGITATVAVLGSSVSDAQLALLSEFAEVVFLFDGDTAGREGAHQAATKLLGRTQVRVIDLPDDHEPEQLSLRTLRWAINGASELDLVYVALRLRLGVSPPTEDVVDGA